MRQIIYFDTSALAKWYLKEARSDDVEKYIQGHGPVDISDLNCSGNAYPFSQTAQGKEYIDPKTEIKIYATFEEDIRQKFLICHPLPAGLAAGAVNLLSVLY